MKPSYLFALREDIKDEKQFLPTRGEGRASGWDVRAAMPDRQPLILKPFQKAKIPLGFRAFCPEEWWFELKPRSSTFTKKHLHSLYGTIDELFEGQLVYCCQYIPELNLIQPDKFVNQLIFSGPMPEDIVISFGDAIGQIIPVRRQEMEVDEASNYTYDTMCKKRGGERGDKGFGSTGR